MKLVVTNAERAGVAFFLGANWMGTEKHMAALLETHEGLRLDEFDVKNVNNRLAIEITPAVTDDASTIEVDLSQETVEELLAVYPSAGVPAMLGPPKARLLRKLRALCPKQEVK